MFYTEEAKNLKTTDAATMRFSNVKTEATNWNLDKHIDVIDTKLFVIEKAIEFCVKKAYSIKIISDIWILTDCANAITRLKKFEFRKHLMEKLHRNCREIIRNKSQHSYSLNFRTLKNFRKFTSRRTSIKEIKEDRKSRQFYVISIFDQKN